MANTQSIKKHVEPYVRLWLQKRYRKSFLNKETPLKLVTGGKHKFDAVSKDGSIVAGIRSGIARPSGRREGVGKIHATYSEIYFLLLVKAKMKILVFTDKRFYAGFKKWSLGKVPKGIELLYCKLPPYARKMAHKAHVASSGEAR